MYCVVFYISRTEKNMLFKLTQASSYEFVVNIYIEVQLY